MRVSEAIKWLAEKAAISALLMGSTTYENRYFIHTRRREASFRGIRTLAERMEAENERLKAEVLALEKAREKQRRALDLALSVLLDYEQWEADLVDDDAVWWKTASGLPAMTQAGYDAYMAIQTKRNSAVKAARAALEKGGRV